MTSVYEVLEYLRVYGRARHKDIEMTFGRKVDWVLYKLIVHGSVRKVYGEDGKKYYELVPSKRRPISFIDDNPKALEQERISGRRFWRPPWKKVESENQSESETPAVR